jgi:hypothetical protein
LCLKGGLSGQSGQTSRSAVSEPREGGADVELSLFSLERESGEVPPASVSEEAVKRLLGLAIVVGEIAPPRGFPMVKV